MDARSFLAHLPAHLGTVLPPELRATRSVSGFGLVKLHYGNPKLHYEANHQPTSQTIEIGLHFEADEFTNTRLLGAFRIHEGRIHRVLPGARLEKWDRGWARIWEPVPYEELDRTLQDNVAKRLARYITTLEPILRDELPADVPWDLARSKPSVRAKRR